MPVIRPIDLFTDLGRMNNGERPSEFGISVNQRSVEFKDIQEKPQCEWVLYTVIVLFSVRGHREDAESRPWPCS